MTRSTDEIKRKIIDALISYIGVDSYHGLSDIENFFSEGYDLCDIYVPLRLKLLHYYDFSINNKEDIMILIREYEEYQSIKCFIHKELAKSNCDSEPEKVNALEDEEKERQKKVEEKKIEFEKQLTNDNGIFKDYYGITFNELVEHYGFSSSFIFFIENSAKSFNCNSLQVAKTFEIDQKSKPVSSKYFEFNGNIFPYRMIVTGKQGSGKSILLKRIALALAKEESALYSEFDISQRLLPIYVDCRCFAIESCFSESNFLDNIINVLIKSYCDVISGDENFIIMLKDLITERLKSGEIIFFLDELEGLGDIEAIDFFLTGFIDFVSDYSNVKFIITARSEVFYALKEIGALRKLTERYKDLKVTQIELFNKYQMKELCSKLSNIDIVENTNNSMITKELFSHRNKYIFESHISRNPLFLTAIIQIIKSLGYVPKTEYDFYNQYIKLSLHWQAEINYNLHDILIVISYVMYTITYSNKFSIYHTDLHQTIEEAQDKFASSLLEKINPDDIIKILHMKLAIFKKNEYAKVNTEYFFEDNNACYFLASYALREGYTEKNITKKERLFEFIRSKDYISIGLFHVLKIYCSKPDDEVVEVLFNYYGKLDPKIKELLSICLQSAYLSVYNRKKIIETFFNDSESIDFILKLFYYLTLENASVIRKTILDLFEKIESLDKRKLKIAFSIIKIFDLISEGKNPIEYAIDLVINSGKISKAIIGFRMLWIILKYKQDPDYQNKNEFYVCLDQDIEFNYEFHEKTSDYFTNARGSYYDELEKFIDAAYDNNSISLNQSFWTNCLFKKLVSDYGYIFLYSIELWSHFPLNKKMLAAFKVRINEISKENLLKIRKEISDKMNFELKYLLYYKMQYVRALFVISLLFDIWDSESDRIETYESFLKVIENEDRISDSERLKNNKLVENYIGIYM